VRPHGTPEGDTGFGPRPAHQAWGILAALELQYQCCCNADDLRNPVSQGCKASTTIQAALPTSMGILREANQQGQLYVN